MSSRLGNILVITLGFGLALGLNLWRLEMVPQLMSDEVYFVPDARHYLDRTFYFDVHPPLGKMQIAAAIAVLGDRPLAWRLPNAIEGALLVPLAWWLAWLFTRSRRAAAISTFLVLTDTMRVTESHIGVINIPYVFFGVLFLCLVLQAQRKNSWRWLLIAAITAGLAISIKWLALTMVLPGLAIWLYPTFFGLRPPALQHRLKIWSSLLLIIPIILYLAIYAIHFSLLGAVQDTLATNLKVFLSHTTGNTGHPYHELWWRWPAMWQPFFYWRDLVGDQIRSLVVLGNPWWWWTGSIIFLISLFNILRQSTFRPFIVFLLSSWLPFILIQRDMFLYHALPFGFFLLLLTGAVLNNWWVNKKMFVAVYLAIGVLCFLWFLPGSLNYPLSIQQDRLRQWLPRWHVHVPVNVATPRPDQLRTE